MERLKWDHMFNDLPPVKFADTLERRPVGKVIPLVETKYASAPPLAPLHGQALPRRLVRGSRLPLRAPIAARSAARPVGAAAAAHLRSQ